MARWSADCTVEELQTQYDQLQEDLNDLEKFIYEKRLNALVDKVGVTLGKTLVEHNGDKYVIADLKEHLRLQEHNYIPWIVGWKLRVNGKPSRVVRYLYLGHEKINIIGEYNG